MRPQATASKMKHSDSDEGLLDVISCLLLCFVFCMLVAPYHMTLIWQTFSNIFNDFC